MIIPPRVLRASRPSKGGSSPEIREEYQRIFDESDAIDRGFAIGLLISFVGLPIACILIYHLT